MKTKLTRRDLLRMMPAALLGAAFFSGWFSGMASAAEAKKQSKIMPPRPPGTCGGWIDKNLNGTCDRSEKGPKRCTAQKCPGNKDNPRRQDARKQGAPNGTCALWEDSDNKGFCAISLREEDPCTYALCPAHLNKLEKGTKKAVPGT